MCQDSKTEPSIDAHGLINAVDHRDKPESRNVPKELTKLHKLIRIVLCKVTYHTKSTRGETTWTCDLSCEDVCPKLLHFLIADIFAFLEEARRPIHIDRCVRDLFGWRKRVGRLPYDVLNVELPASLDPSYSCISTPLDVLRLDLAPCVDHLHIGATLGVNDLSIGLSLRNGTGAIRAGRDVYNVADRIDELSAARPKVPGKTISGPPVMSIPHALVCLHELAPRRVMMRRRIGIADAGERAGHAPSLMAQIAVDLREVGRHAEVCAHDTAIIDVGVQLANDPDRLTRPHGVSIERVALFSC